MKLFLTVVLASVLMMKTAEGTAQDLGVACDSAADTCPANAECVDDGGTDKCSCMATYTESTSAAGTCKLKSGETCSGAAVCAVNACNYNKCGKATGDDCTVKTDCAVDACTDTKCGKANDATCTMNTDCATLNCKYMDDGSDKCAGAGAAGVVASVLLMVATLMTSRIL